MFEEDYDDSETFFDDDYDDYDEDDYDDEETCEKCGLELDECECYF